MATASTALNTENLFSHLYAYVYIVDQSLIPGATAAPDMCLALCSGCPTGRGEVDGHDELLA